MEDFFRDSRKRFFEEQQQKKAGGENLPTTSFGFSLQSRYLKLHLNAK